jgi:hypothetical protein
LFTSSGKSEPAKTHFDQRHFHYSIAVVGIVIMRTAFATSAIVLLLAGAVPIGDASAAETLRLGGAGSAIGMLQQVGAKFTAATGVKVEVIASLGSTGDVPTVVESAGIEDFDFTLWAGVFAPRGTPPAIVARLNSEMNKVLEDHDTRKKLVDAGADVEPMSVAQFRAFVNAESSKYSRIITETGVHAE